MLPNVFIVGAAKSGTTTLADLLGQHPQILVPAIKEPHFLLRENVRRHLPSSVHCREDFESLYHETPPRFRRVDASVLYLPFAASCARSIRELAGPEAKIIVILREPLARARSAYQHFRRYNSIELGTFAEACASEPPLGTGNPMRCFFQLSQYVDSVKTYQSHFANVLVVTTDVLKRDPAGLLEQVWTFLDVERADVTLRHRNAADFEWRTNGIRKAVNRLMPPRARTAFRNAMPGVYARARDWTVRHLGREPSGDISVPPDVAAWFALERERCAQELGIRFEAPDHA